MNHLWDPNTGDLWERVPAFLVLPVTSDHPELFINYTLNHWRLCQGRQGNHCLSSLHRQLRTHTHKSQLLSLNLYCEICNWLTFNDIQTYQLNFTTPMQCDYCCIFPCFAHTSTDALYAQRVHYISGPIRMKCHKNVTQKCQSVITHTKQQLKLG